MVRKVSLSDQIDYLNQTRNSFHRGETTDTVVIKAARGETESDVLKRFQDQTPYLRAMIDEIEEPSDPPTIFLKYLDDHLLNASIKKALNLKEVKYVSKRILEALKVFHEEGYVHTGTSFPQSLNKSLAKSNIEDVKLDNVLVNYREGDILFSDVQLCNVGGTYSANSEYAKAGTPVEALM